MAAGALDIPVGAALTLDIAFTRDGARHVAKNVECILAGLDHGQFVMVRIPEKMMTLLGKYLGRGATATVKYLRENFSCAFTSPVVGQNSEFAPMLWLGYPLEIASYPIRKEPRVACNPHALVKCGKHRYDGLVADISGSGCRILVSPAAETDPKPLCMGALVEVRFQLPGQVDPITADGEVRWLKTGDIPWGLGVSFTMMDERSQLKIQRFLSTAFFYG